VTRNECLRKAHWPAMRRAPARACYGVTTVARRRREIGFSFLLSRRFESLNLDPWHDKE